MPNNLLMTARKKDIRVRQIAMKASTNVYDMVRNTRSQNTYFTNKMHRKIPVFFSAGNAN